MNTQSITGEVFALWWDDAKGSTFLDVNPFNTEAEAHAEAERRGLKVYITQKVRASDVRYFFPKS